MDPRAEQSRYFDYASTAPLQKGVLEAMLPYLTFEFGNANSLHGFGQRALAAVEKARERIALLVDAEDPSQLAFVSGATEANNWVLKAFPRAVVSPFEHSSIYEIARSNCLEFIPNQADQLLEVSGKPEVISLMEVNNETGMRWDVRSFKCDGVLVHSDVTQAVGKLPVSVMGLDFASFSGHKFGGPKGIGCLFAARNFPEPLLWGGDQELGLRAGTLNVPGIVGMGEAAHVALETLQVRFEQAVQLRQIFLDEIRELSGWTLSENRENLPHIVNVCFEDIEGESLTVALDNQGFAVSSGAACSSRSHEPSHVLLALGLSANLIRGAIRVSFGPLNTPDSVYELAKALRFNVKKLRIPS